MNKKFIIIGAGLEQIRAYTLAKEMGLFVIGTDINPTAPAFKYADESLICSTRNVQETLSVVLEYARKNTIHGVMTLGNDAALTVASVASSLDLPGISVKSAEMATNKILMKNQFVKHGIPTPLFSILENKEDFLAEVKSRKFPLILKPSDGRGSRGVLYLDDTIDISWAWGDSIENSENKIMLLEDFIFGDQLSVEGMFIDKQFVSAAFADRNYKNLHQTKPYIIEDGGIIPSCHEGAVLNEIAQCIEKAAQSLGITEGPVKADIVLSEEGPMIIELAARLSGNYLASHHLRWALGIDIVSAVIRYSLGLEVTKEFLKPKFKRYLAARYFFPPSGTITAIEGVSEVNLFDYVKKLDIYRKIGDFQPVIRSNVDRAGIVRCMGDSLNKATMRVENIVKMISFKIDRI